MTPTATSGKERLQRILVDLGRLDRSGRPARRSDQRTAGKERPAGPDPERLLELVKRLDRIERKLTDLAEPVDGIPDRFDRWIAEGHWERVTFTEFLRLRK